MSDGIPSGRLFVIGGGEDRCCGAGVLERFIELSGGDQARITLVTTATDIPDEVHAEYEQVFRKLGVENTTELRLRGRADADSDLAEAVLRDATGVFFSGGDQSRIRALVGSRSNEILSERLAAGLVIAGTSAGATALGRTMILGGQRADVSAATVRTAPGLGLLSGVLIDMHFAERGRLPRLLAAVALAPDRDCGFFRGGSCRNPPPIRIAPGTGLAQHAVHDCVPLFFPARSPVMLRQLQRKLVIFRIICDLELQPGLGIIRVARGHLVAVEHIVNGPERFILRDQILGGPLRFLISARH